MSRRRESSGATMLGARPRPRADAAVKDHAIDQVAELDGRRSRALNLAGEFPALGAWHLLPVHVLVNQLHILRMLVSTSHLPVDPADEFPALGWGQGFVPRLTQLLIVKAELVRRGQRGRVDGQPQRCDGHPSRDL